MSQKSLASPIESRIESQRSALTLRDVADTLFRRQRSIFPLFILLLVITAAVVFLKPDVYESEMILLVKNERAEAIVSPAQASATGRGEVGEAQIATEMALLSGRELFREVARQCDLASLNPGDAPERRALLLEKAARKLARDIKISPVPRANMIKVAYSARNPALAALVLQVLADEYMKIHLKVHGASGTYRFFDQQARLYERELREAETKLAQFQRKTDIVMLAQQKDLNLHKLIDLEGVLRDTQVTRDETRRRIATLNGKLSGMNARITTQARSIPNQYSVERLSTMLAEMRNKRTELLARLLPNDRNVLQIEQQISDTQSALGQASKLAATEETTDVNPLRQSLAAELAQAELSANTLQARSEGLSQHVTGYRRELAKLELSTADDGDLNRTIKNAEESYQLYAKKREEARITDALDKDKIANVAVAEPSSVPLIAKPKLSGAVVAGFLFGTLAILGVSFLIGIRRGTVHTPWELEGLTYIPVLATVPNLRGAGQPPAREFSMELSVQKEIAEEIVR
ncbi:MAG: GumC family protein [Bryobacteraceae bacterium]